MKTGILIVARLGSQRLKRKHLLLIKKQPILMFLIQRIQVEFQKELEQNSMELILATSEKKENREFEKLFEGCTSIFFGSDNNIPLRHWQVAQCHHLDAIIAVDGDDILCSVEAMRRVYECLMQGHVYVKTSNLPLGMNTFGYSTAFLSDSLQTHQKSTLENGWGWIFNSDLRKDIAMPCETQDDHLRFTLDYLADFEFFRAVIEHLGASIAQATDAEIINLVLEQQYFTINGTMNEAYLKNINQKMQQEQENAVNSSS